MLKSMTGFGAREREIKGLGKVSVEMRSSNHKFLEAVFHLPEGFLSLEDKIKGQIESKLKRGRITCAINISASRASGVSVNKELLKKYLAAFRGMKKEFGLRDDIGIGTLIHLPGVMALETDRSSGAGAWPKVKGVVKEALEELAKTRAKEGGALFGYLGARAAKLSADIAFIKSRFRQEIKQRIAALTTDDERTSFLKDTDITEEIERLIFHVSNFRQKLRKPGSVGKELDFIAQEMQREANTLAAKSFDVVISGRIIEVKSQIEKIREQVQNVE